MLGFGSVFLAPQASAALDCSVPANKSSVECDPYQCKKPVNSNSLICKDRNENINSTITTVINIILYFLGAISVLVIIFAGILYVMSGGDANSVTKAKNTLLYAVVGLIVAMLAYAIVNFVLTTFK